MAIPQNIFLPDQIERRIEEGLIRRQRAGDLQILNYTEDTQYGRKWDKYTRACRGLILDSNYNLVALPFEKFFNLGEPDCPALPDSRNSGFEAYAKIDGSLGIWFYYQGQWCVATRGSFDNDYTRWAEANAPDLSACPKTWTVMTEICMPAALDGMPRAVKHEPGIYFLGATDLYSLTDLNPHVASHAWRGPTAKIHEAASIDELTHKAKHHEGEEGWVIRYHTGLRIKIKTAWYLQIFRAISSLNEKHIKELMLRAGMDAWLKDFPEELREEAEAIYTGIQARFTARREFIMREFAHLWNPDRKTFALSIQDHPDKSYLFTLYDHHNIDAKLLASC